MKHLVWNVRGLGNPSYGPCFMSACTGNASGCIFLCDTLVGHHLMESIRVQLGIVGKLVVNKIGRSGGLCLFWADSVSVKLLSFSFFHIDVLVDDSSSNCWRFTGFYGHPEASQRIHGWNLLRRLSSLHNFPWFCGGDYNEILNDNEKKGGSNRAQGLMDNFGQALDDCNLLDLGFVICGFDVHLV
ncbi:hypothetical protein ACOSQ2_013845 [Xanthoceras sorbifolium]